MPSAWVEGVVVVASTPVEAVRRVKEEAQVSVHAATLKVVHYLGPNYVFAQLSDGVVTASGCSPKTAAYPPNRGEPLDLGLFPYASAHWSYSGYRWWFLGVGDVPEPANPNAEWRDVLGTIIADLGLEFEEAKSFKQTVNGIVAAANSHAPEPKTAASIYSRCLQRLHVRAPEDAAIRMSLNHPLMIEFLALRIAKFVA